MAFLRIVFQCITVCYFIVALEGTLLTNIISQQNGKLMGLLKNNHVIPITFRTRNRGYTSKKIYFLTYDNIKKILPKTKDTFSISGNETRNSVNTINYEQYRATPNTSLRLKYFQSVTEFNKRFYNVTYSNLMANAPKDKTVNGVSFVQSGIFIHLLLTAISTQVDPETNVKIENTTEFSVSIQEKMDAIQSTVAWLPKSDKSLKFRWASRLLVSSHMKVNTHLESIAKKINLKIDNIDNARRSGNFIETLNDMIEEDSGGTIHDTFDANEALLNETSILISTVYMRARWRVAPTLLNETKDFFDGDTTKQIHMIRLIDQVNYADLEDLDAQIVEIQYATPGLSLVMIVPRSGRLHDLAERVARDGVRPLLRKMKSVRAAVYLPLYTLRMTLLLHNKLPLMGVNELFLSSPDDPSARHPISYAVQRIMFWSEAGRHAFKDDGLLWEEKGKLDVVLDRPFLLFLQWRNVTIMNGHFNL